MSSVEWYYALGDEQMGPVGAAEIKRLAAAGQLRPDDLVWRDGLAEWVPAAKIKGLFEEQGGGAAIAQTPSRALEPPATIAETPSRSLEPTPSLGEMLTAPPPPPPPPAVPPVHAAGQPRRPGSHLFDRLLDSARPHFSEHFVNSTAAVFAACGYYAIYLAMPAVLVFAIILAVKTGGFSPILRGVAAVAMLAVLQYVAARFFGALERLNRNTPGRISSTAFPDCFALVMLAAGVVLLLTSAVLAVQQGDHAGIFAGLAYFILCEYAAFVAMNPASLRITVAAESRAGEEAIGVLSFLIKLGARLVPVALGVGVVWGIWGLLRACYLAFQPEGPAGGPKVAEATAVAAAWRIIAFAALPLAAYVTFLVYYLWIDVVRAVLAIPGKLDALKKDEPEEPGRQGGTP